MIPHSTTGASVARLAGTLALLLQTLWLSPPALAAGAGAPSGDPALLLKMVPATEGPELPAALSGSPGGDSVVIDVGRNVTLPNPADYYAVTRIGIREKAARPCVLTLWGRMVDPRYGGEADRELATFELERCRGLAGWIELESAGFPADRRFVRSLRVCGGRDAAAAYSSFAWEIAGLMVQPGAIAPASAAIEALPDLDSFTRPECPRQIAASSSAAGWTGWSACPAGQLVTGLRAHYYDNRYLTGLSVRCKRAAWRMPASAPVRDVIGY